MIKQPNVVFIVGDNVGWRDIGLLRRSGADSPDRSPVRQGDALQELQRRGAMHADEVGAPDRPPAIRTGNCSVPLPGQGDDGLVHWLAELDHAPGRSWMQSTRRASPMTRSSCGAVTTRLDVPPPWVAPTGLGVVTSGRGSRAACARRRWCPGQAGSRPVRSPTRSSATARAPAARS